MEQCVTQLRNQTQTKRGNKWKTRPNKAKNLSNHDSEASQLVEADNLPIVDLLNHDITAKSKQSIRMNQINHSSKHLSN